MHKDRLKLLQQTLSTMGVDVFLQPVNDPYLGEYPPPQFRRLEWLTGFTGSAGTVAVLAQGTPAFFTDGRYTVQAEQEVTRDGCSLFNSGETSPDRWLKETLHPGMTVGYDPFLFSQAQIRRYQKAFEGMDIHLKPLEANPIDALWNDRPKDDGSPVFFHPLRYTGLESFEKIAAIAADLKRKGADATVIAAPDSINWLLNLRGRDVPNAPIALAYAILKATGEVMLFLDPARVSQEVRGQLAKGVTVRPPQEMSAAIGSFSGQRVLTDPAETPAWFFQTLITAGAVIVEGENPCALPKACKNEVELDGMRAAHVRDGAAVVKLLHWLDEQANVTELDVVAKLEAFRTEDPSFVEPSFPTIAGSGPNGAIVHYRATKKSNRTLDRDSLFLLDSGGQYPDGTTDITRTIAIGTPSAEMKERFTRVLKGHIALANAVFPAGTAGGQLDVLARQPLWIAGLDYDHGTGHGVGSFLSVHEGPQRISKRGGDVALKPGMILSNEPGYYKTGAYGIRIENLVCVLELSGIGPANDRPFYGFETLTLAPIDLRAVEVGMLSNDERLWLNQYHARVLASLSPMLNAAQRAWLQSACKAV